MVQSIMPAAAGAHHSETYATPAEALVKYAVQFARERRHQVFHISDLEVERALEGQFYLRCSPRGGAHHLSYEANCLSLSFGKSLMNHSSQISIKLPNLKQPQLDKLIQALECASSKSLQVNKFLHSVAVLKGSDPLAPDLTGLQIEGMVLEGLDLGNCILDQINVRRSELRNCHFEGSSFRESAWSSVKLHDCDFGGSKWDSGVSISNCDFTNNILNNADLRGISDSKKSPSIFKGNMLLAASCERSFIIARLNSMLETLDRNSTRYQKERLNVLKFFDGTVLSRDFLSTELIDKLKTHSLVRNAKQHEIRAVYGWQSFVKTLSAHSGLETISYNCAAGKVKAIEVILPQGNFVVFERKTEQGEDYPEFCSTLSSIDLQLNCRATTCLSEIYSRFLFSRRRYSDYAIITDTKQEDARSGARSLEDEEEIRLKKAALKLSLQRVEEDLSWCKELVRKYLANNEYVKDQIRQYLSS